MLTTIFVCIGGVLLMAGMIGPLFYLMWLIMTYGKGKEDE